jgi:hypothetical protein
MIPGFSKLAHQNSRIKVQFFGQWEEAIRTLNRLGPNIKEASIAAQMGVMNDIKNRVKGHLRNQDIPEMTSKPYNDQYAKAKKELGRDPRFLMSSGTYYRSIQVWKVGTFNFAFVGVRNGIKTKSLTGNASRLDVARIAYMHEMGGKHLPRRPLWNPTIREMGGANGIKDLFVQHLYLKLRRKKVPIALNKFTRNRIFNTKSWD